MRRILVAALYVLPILFLLAFYAYPLLAIFRVSFSGAAPGVLSQALEMVTAPSFWRVLWFTTWQAALSTLLTVLVELDLARADRASTLAATVRTTVRNAVLHPVTLPVLVGLAWNVAGLGLHPVLDDALAMLGSAVVPTCLVLIGFSLAQYGLKGRLRGAMTLVGLKLALLPAVVLAVAHVGFGLSGVPLGVVVMLAALPVGSNALIFAQRYGVHEAEATAGIVVTTALFVLTASVWLTVLAWVG